MRTYQITVDNNEQFITTAKILYYTIEDAGASDVYFDYQDRQFVKEVLQTFVKQNEIQHETN